jgi:hypothetical protein
MSPLLYCLGIGLSFAGRWLGMAFYVVVALMWLVPDRRVERTVRATGTRDAARENESGRTVPAEDGGPPAVTSRPRQ